MALAAPMHVPVEIARRGGRTRWFRLTSAVTADALSFAQMIPDELDGPLDIAFHLPGDGVPVRCRGRAVEEVVGQGDEERAERRGVSFLDLDETARVRISTYVNERLGIS